MLLPGEMFIEGVHDWTRVKVPADQDHLVIQNTPTYTKYEFYVKAYNQQAGDGISGEATEIAKLYEGYSGEDRPGIVPRNFGLKNNRLIDARTAIFNWSYIQEDEASRPGGMNGQLSGFLIQFFKADGNLGRIEIKNHKVCSL